MTSMKRSLIIFSLITLLSIIGIYIIRNGADASSERLARIVRNIEAEQIEQQTLLAEWSSLNNPERLQKLARKHLNLAEVHARQIVDFINRRAALASYKEEGTFDTAR